MDRRSFIKGMLWVPATPAIVRATSLMNISVLPGTYLDELKWIPLLVRLERYESTIAIEVYKP